MDTSYGKNKRQGLPLFVAYALVVVPSLIVQLIGAGILPVEFYIDVPRTWFIVCGLGAILAAKEGYKTPSFWRVGRTIFALLVVAFLCFTLAPRFIGEHFSRIAFIQECAPIASIFFALIWVKNFGIPSRLIFQKCGAMLAVVVILDTVIEGIAFQELGLLRAIGDMNIAATFLLISLCATLFRSLPTDGKSKRMLEDPDEGSSLLQMLILLGLAATLARPALFAGAWIVLWMGRGSLVSRCGQAFLLVGTFITTFYIPLGITHAMLWLEYTFWSQGVSVLQANSGVWMTGFPFALPLEFNVSEIFNFVWEAAKGSPFDGILMLSDMTSFWLRLLLSWGGIFAGTLTLAFFITCERSATRMACGVVAIIFTQGLISPLFYDPSCAIVLVLALCAASVRRVNSDASLPLT